MKRFEIREAMLHEVQAFYVDFSRTWVEIHEYRTKLFYVKGLFADNRPIGIAGIAKKVGKLWAFFDIMPGSHQIGAFLVVEMRRYLKNLARGHPIYVQVNDAHATAPELMRALGFAPTDEIHEGMRVFQWQS